MPSDLDAELCCFWYAADMLLATADLLSLKTTFNGEPAGVLSIHKHILYGCWYTVVIFHGTPMSLKILIPDCLLNYEPEISDVIGGRLAWHKVLFWLL